MLLGGRPAGQGHVHGHGADEADAASAAFKLEALTDPSLPGDGPGPGRRGAAELRAEHVRRHGRPGAAARRGEPVKLVDGRRPSFSQANFDVAGAIDGDPKTAWAIDPQFHKPHWATFETDEPLGFDGRHDADVHAGAELRRRAGPSAGCGCRPSPATARRERGPGRGRRRPRGRRPTKRTAAQTEAAARLPAGAGRRARTPARRTQRARSASWPKRAEPPTTLVMQELPQPRPTHDVQARRLPRPRRARSQPGTPGRAARRCRDGPAEPPRRWHAGWSTARTR